MRLSILPVLFLPLILTGCALQTTATPSAATGRAINGSIHGGQQPIAGVHVYLFAANTNGYGGSGIAPSAANASLSLLNAATTGLSDSVGAYVLTNQNGQFTITGDYTCTAGQQVYVLGLGGNPGAGTNSSSGLMALLGNCPGPSFDPNIYIAVNEVSTVAAAYAVAGFASDATHVSSSGTALAQTGIANAFANAANLATLASGAALATTPSGIGTAPQTEIDTLANILATCVNSSDAVPASCTTLFANARFAGTSGTTPADTASAAINIAHNPGANVANLYALATPASPFAPALTAQPNDFSVSINFVPPASSVYDGIAVDAGGNIWAVNTGGSAEVVKLSSAGYNLSGSNGFALTTSTQGTTGFFVAIDNSGNAWVTGKAYGVSTGGVYELSPTGTVLSGAASYPSTFSAGCTGIALDGTGNVWAACSTSGVLELASSGAVLSNGGFYTAGSTTSANFVALDGSGNAWTSNLSSSVVQKFSPVGNQLFTSGGVYTSGRFGGSPLSIALDGVGDGWIGLGGNSGFINELSNSGSLFSNTNSYSAYTSNTGAVAFDGAGTIWFGETQQYGSANALFHYSAARTNLSGQYGYFTPGSNGPKDIAVDGSGNVWQTTSAGITQTIGIATPVITPIVAGLPATATTDGSSNLATRP